MWNNDPKEDMMTCLLEQLVALSALVAGFHYPHTLTMVRKDLHPT